MGSRKRSRPNPQVETTPETPLDDVGQAAQAAVPSNTSGHIEHASSKGDSASNISNRFLQDDNSIKTHSSRAWYAGGSWPRIQKASPSTQVARETILADKPKNAPNSVDFSRFEPRRTDATSASASSPQPPPTDPGEIKEGQELTLSDIGAEVQGVTVPVASTDKYSNTTNGNSNPPKLNAVEAQGPITASGWREWFGLSNVEPKAHPELPQPHNVSDGDEHTLRETNAQQRPQESSVNRVISERMPSSKSEGENAVTASAPSSSWFNVWPGSVSNKKMAEMTTSGIRPEDTPMPGEPAVEAPAGVESKRPLPGSTWAFWSNDSKRPAEKGVEVEETGELAVTGEPSQNNPAPAHATILEESKDDRVKKTNKRGRQLLDDVQEPTSKAVHSGLPNKNQAPQIVSLAASESSNKATPPQSPVPLKSLPLNLLLPSFRSTYRLVENPSIIQQIGRLLMHSHQSPANHVYLVKDPPRIKKALAIGIHGLFPAPLLRTVIGQPTGTSIRFANHAAAAIHRWASARGFDCDVEKVALEGEGKIAERVDNLWKLLLNWIDHVRSADLIIIACHSQGVPVALMLVAKLIEFGVVTTARIGVCAMAGVSLGPFADYKSRLFSGSAAELFEFANQNSEVSKRYQSSLRVALKYGVRVGFIGSIDDQLVSLESAIFSPVNHPYIYRAVFVDGRVHTPDFIAHLVGFALKLRNLGVSDHGLIRELSVPLAGSLYTGEGHSRLYDEVKIYDDVVCFTLETTSIGDVPLQVQKFEIPTSTNPFQLPWSMRGLLEEDIVKTELDQETAELLKQFDEWKPTTKVLKDVKYRLEALKSKL